MKLPEEFDEQPKMGLTVVRMIIGVTLFISAILVLILLINSENIKNGMRTPSQAQPDDSAGLVADEGTPDTFEPGTLTPDDFDFWDLYPEETEEPAQEESVKKEEVSDPATDGKHTLVVTADGKEEWVLISPYLPKNEYDYTKLVCQSDLMKYFEDGRQM